MLHRWRGGPLPRGWHCLSPRVLSISLRYPWLVWSAGEGWLESILAPLPQYLELARWPCFYWELINSTRWLSASCQAITQRLFCTRFYMHTKYVHRDYFQWGFPKNGDSPLAFTLNIHHGIFFSCLVWLHVVHAHLDSRLYSDTNVGHDMLIVFYK